MTTTQKRRKAIRGAEEGSMKPISKYRRKVMARTLLGQKLAEALKDERPDSRKVQPLDFCNFPDKGISR